MKKIILMISVVVMGLIFYSLFESDNINSLEGNFRELAFERNENNTGPIQRVYVFSVEDTLWSEMEKHSDLLPHTKYGTTEVYYFLEQEIDKSQLKLSLKGINKEAKSNCIAHSVKDGQGRINFKRYPF